MEHLTKAQIVLLTLFTSFVASMATGIVVVTLMQQAPEPVTQTLTRVVERTIEKIAAGSPSSDKTPAPAPVMDEDLTVSAVARNIKSTVAFKSVGQDGTSHSAGVGTIVSADGLVITSAGNLGGGVLTTTIDGQSYALQVIPTDSTSPLGIGKLTPTGTSTAPVSFTPVTLGDPNVLQLGQTAIIIGGWDAKTISSGLINSLDQRTVADKEKNTTSKVLSNIGVSVYLGGVSSGAPIINLSGEVVGFLSIDEGAGTQAGIPASEATRLIGLATKPAVPAKTNK